MDALIVYPENKEQLSALKSVMKAMNIAFEQKSKVYPDYVINGVKDSLQQVQNKQLTPFNGIKEMLNTIPEKLLQTAINISKKEQKKLTELKERYKELSREDFVWHFLLCSFATMGKSSGWHGLIGNKTNYEQLNFDLLSNIDNKNKLNHIEVICRRAKVRMPGIKATYIFNCHLQIINLGGLKKTKEMLLNIPGREGKINFLKSFSGIGDKYARNIMMDVYHEDFRDSIAVDSRIKNIPTFWNLKFSTYGEHEVFYLNLAKEAGLNGWELDRLMYNYEKDFKIQ